MVLGFNPQFVPKILDGTKIHTLRKYPHQSWKAGRSIQFATGVIALKHYKTFREDGKCSDTQMLVILTGPQSIYLVDEAKEYSSSYYLHQSIQHIRFDAIKELDSELISRNDGFESVEDFWKWFNKDQFMKCIHWTDFKY